MEDKFKFKHKKIISSKLFNLEIEDGNKWQIIFPNLNISNSKLINKLKRILIIN